MKRVAVIGTAALLLILGATPFGYAQEETGKQGKQQQQDRNNQNQQRGQQQQEEQNRSQQRGAQQQQEEQNRSQQRGAQQQQQDQNRQQQQQRAQQQQQDQNRQQVPRQQQANRTSEQERRGKQGEQRAVWQEHRARSFQSEHRTWQQRGGYNGSRIPEDRYQGYFGPDHAFRIYSYPVAVIGGYPRFQYGGFWFSVLDPWPEYWSDNWYDDDDMYIDYSGVGYYMYNRRYPRDRIAISVLVN
jgi:hypothetical protein